MKNRKGFTIVELIVVMAVIAVLVSMGVPRFLGYTKDARATALVTDAKLLESAGYQFALGNDDVFPLADADTATAGIQPFTVVPTSSLGVALEALDPAPANAPLVYLIAEASVQPFIRSMSNEINEFVMTADGVVLHVLGQENSRGEQVHGIGVVVPATP